MVYRPCKTILHYRRAITASPFQYTHYLQGNTSIISIKHVSTISNPHSFKVSYLINSCGLSQDSALSATKYIHFESPEKPDSVIAFFKNHGFTKSQILKVIVGNPQVLTASPDKSLLPKLEFLKSKGFSTPEIAHTLSVCPQILKRSLKNHLIPNFNHLTDLLKSTEMTVATIKRQPRIIYIDFEAYILSKVNILRDHGVLESNIAMFTYNWGDLFKIPLDSFKNAVEEVKEMGFNPLRSQFVIAVVVKAIATKSMWETRLNAYKKWGWSDNEVLTAFGKDPWCMMASEDKIMTVMDFFVNKLGWGTSVIVRRPNLVKLSMEKRFIPRAAVLQFLSSKGLIKRKNPYSVGFFECTEKTFLKTFVNSYDEAPEILKLYKEKMDLSKMTGRSV